MTKKTLKPEYQPGGAQRHVIIDKAVIKEGKTKTLRKNIQSFGKKKLLIIDGPTVDKLFSGLPFHKSDLSIRTRPL